MGGPDERHRTKPARRCGFDPNRYRFAAPSGGLLWAAKVSLQAAQQMCAGTDECRGFAVKGDIVWEQAPDEVLMVWFMYDTPGAPFGVLLPPDEDPSYCWTVAEGFGGRRPRLANRH